MDLHLPPITPKIIEICADVITRLGYTGIFLLMVCESMYVPIPSFAVMPFVGFVAHEVADGKLAEGPTLWTGTLVGALGGIVGSLLTYYFGLYAGPVGVRRWGRWVGLVEHDLDATQAWFDKRGAVTVFTGRFIPVVRHFISTVAGLARMRLPLFLGMTFAGAFLWDLILAALGWHLQANYPVIKKYQGPIDIVVILCFLVGGIHIFRKLRARMRKPEGAPGKQPASDLDAPGKAP